MGSSFPDFAAYSYFADYSAFDSASNPAAGKAFEGCFVLSYFAAQTDFAATSVVDNRDSFPDKAAFVDRIDSSSADWQHLLDFRNYLHKAYSSAAYSAVLEAEESPAFADMD